MKEKTKGILIIGVVGGLCGALSGAVGYFTAKKRQAINAEKLSELSFRLGRLDGICESAMAVVDYTNDGETEVENG